MHISTKTLWLALHRVFSVHSVGVGCSLSLKDIMDAWPESGLRQADLGRALESLGRAGFVKLEMSEEGPRVKMIDEQFGLLRSHSDDQKALKDLAMLRDSRRRPSGHLKSIVQQREDRRSDDHRAAA